MVKAGGAVAKRPLSWFQPDALGKEVELKGEGSQTHRRSPTGVLERLQSTLLIQPGQGRPSAALRGLAPFLAFTTVGLLEMSPTAANHGALESALLPSPVTAIPKDNQATNNKKPAKLLLEANISQKQIVPVKPYCIL